MSATTEGSGGGDTYENQCLFPKGEITTKETSRFEAISNGFVFYWTLPTKNIEKLQMLMTENRTPVYLASSKFTTSLEKTNTSADWSLQFTTSKDEHGVEFLAIYLWMMKLHGELAGERALNVHYKFRIHNREYTKIVYERRNSIRRFGPTEDKTCWGWREFISIDKLGKSQSCLFLSVIVTILQDEVESSKMRATTTGGQYTNSSGYGSLIHKNVEGSKAQDASLPISDMKKYIARLWKTKKGWDLIINCDLVSFQAHTSILSARSSVFATLFENQVPINSKYHYDMKEIDSNLVEAILEFSYTGDTIVFQHFLSCAKLCKIGHFLQMKSLTGKSFQELTKPDNLKTWTVVFVLKHAKYVLDQPSCFEALAEFISNNFQEIQEMASFRKWMDEDAENPSIFATILFP